MSMPAESSNAARATCRRAAGIVRAASLIVPASCRREWLREWDGELSYRIWALDRAGRLDARAAAAILFRTLGAFPHALWVLRNETRLETMLQDIRYALRSSLRRPAFALLVVLTLGVGIGANSAMFSIVNSVLLQPLPYERSEELVYIFGAFRGGNQASISPPDFLDYRERQTVFSSLAARTLFGTAVIGGADRPERVPASIATANFFSTLGVQPILGRAFRPDEEQGAHDVVILSHGLWQQRFGENPGVLGTSVSIDGRPHTVVGVLPPLLDRMINVQVWRPVPFGVGETTVRRFHFLRGLARLAPGVTVAQAQREMDGIARQLEQAYPENETWKLRLVPYHEVVVGNVGGTLIVLLGAVGLVLLIACGNVASLLLARATARSGEMAVRTALGASRPRLVRQLLTESLVLGLAAGTVGLGLAYYLVQGVRAVGAGIVPRLAELALDQTALLFTFALSLTTSLVFGLAPALHAAKGGVAAAMTSLGRGSGGRTGARTRDVLVVAQVAVSFVMLIVAGLLIRSLWQLQRVDPGFDPHRVFTAEIGLPEIKYPVRADAERFWSALIDRVRSIPGVEAAAGTTLLPLRGGGDTYFYVDGRPPATDADKLNATVSVVTDDYFQTMRIPVRSGRTFTGTDRADGPGVMLINEGLARRLFPGGNAVGERLIVDFGRPFRGEIVGVVSDVRLYGQTNDVPDQMYFSIRQPGAGFRFSATQMRLVARVQGDPTSITPQVRALLKELDAEVPLASVEPMADILSGSIRDVRFRAGLLAGFAGAAFLLAVIGLYGVLAYSVTRRSRELGIRMALGARSAEVFRLVVREGMLLVALGVALGLAGSFAATRFVSGMLFDVASTDLNVFVAVTLALLGSGLAACLLPARRATRVDAMEALRSE
jgi:putative ABC transport system permease protein